ncbi:MAG: bifunctional biotin--[acetyl-CoA-carboxylase] ligase/biotin operon repressor BirA [Gammaproteobacteria bacterium]|jgi:BirA family biotin operon repressor/biotin-[acetyl-CoA-carboxylase] ligase|nr:bifunctional biotin--[acetyl-CoA-carboxylase] ligase/biotin operon repressor BirA [Gammaproteobacteria bacterium]MCP4881428.1 bifunctional biotin--[acetyl-CoA-carboxylase] ligase/biotin operon repressor BirA [Gammaproteobacteria bacterium]MDP6165911.1 bifunctional biotin--[acetyl-CoA-carboxylase] ligase/biotin operon repressor BirA [Gammaproteobacteria bacterium]
MSLTSLNQLLHLLADGKFHSGTELGERLQMSRAAVWKQLKGIEQLGVQVHRVRGKGYRLPHGLDLLDVEAIVRHDPQLAQLFDVELLMSTESTNRLLMQRQGDGAIHGQAVFAEVQTGGRGRLGRQWQSPFAQQLALSVGWQFAGGVAALEGLSLVVGLAVVDALQSVGVSGAGLKWPNDVLMHGKKLAGVLLELSGDATGPCQVVIGIGLNVHLRDCDLIDQPWTSLQQAGYSVSRNVLAAALLGALAQRLTRFAEAGFKPMRQDWINHHVYQGQVVNMLGLADEKAGICHGVDDSGALLIESHGLIQSFNGGEVSLRLVGSPDSLAGVRGF